MTNFGRVIGPEAPLPIEVTATAVLVAKDIQPYTLTMDGKPVEGYTYSLISYDKDEYIQMLIEKNETMETELLDTQMALCDVYELIAGGLA